MKDAQGHGSNSKGGQAAVTSWRAAHQEGIRQSVPSLIKAFVKNESGEGRSLGELKSYDPEPTSRLIGEGIGAAASGEHAGLAEVGKTLIHLAHFLGVLGALALVDLMAHLVGIA